MHLGPARAGDPVMAQWDLPTLDDPRWHAPATPSSRKRTITTVLVAAAVAGGLADAAIAFPRGGSDHAGRSDQSTATASPAAHEDSTARHTGSAAPDGTTRAPEPAADPRRATVPTDPLRECPTRPSPVPGTRPSQATTSGEPAP
ncbi:hypothetical protein O1M54_03000 [Streptomyces diastatochromogenes]|nr:hypothetical protein [Streptomyces diastatochromogenes]